MTKKNKKIGIITMHRVQNFGSALQAYALQKKLSDLGYESEIIDYMFPNVGYNSEKRRFSILAKKIISFFANAIMGFPNFKKKKRFDCFYKEMMRLSDKTYSTRKCIEENPPVYDLYLTGSDQVWNPRYVGEDTTFMFSFVKDNKPRLSYASSFATDSIPNELKDEYKRRLLKYKYISVRERSGIKVINDLIDKNTSLVCDPTLLLRKEEWNTLIKNSKINIQKPYILVYILTYSFNPYPGVEDIINTIQKKINLPVVYLNGQKKDLFKLNSKVIKDAGPNEFVSLIMNASFVITTSFHGTIFALNFEIPFYSIIKDFSLRDSRIYSFLSEVGAEKSALIYNQLLDDDVPLPTSYPLDELDDFRKKSEFFLSSNLERELNGVS